MDIRIGRHLYKNLSNTDWVLDNGYVCTVMTRRHKSFQSGRASTVCAELSRLEFDNLVKKGVLIRHTELEKSEEWAKTYGSDKKYKAWRFNVEPEDTVK